MMKPRLAWMLAIAAMALAFAAYLQPEFMLDWGNRIALCL
jgi:hypothetical protein